MKEDRAVHEIEEVLRRAIKRIGVPENDDEFGEAIGRLAEVFTNKNRLPPVGSEDIGASLTNRP